MPELSPMSLEAFLARLYTDADLRARFLADPAGEARRAGLDEASAERLTHIDRAGLELAAHSFAAKRSKKK